MWLQGPLGGMLGPRANILIQETGFLVQYTQKVPVEVRLEI